MSFFKNVLATVTGIFISFILLFLLMIIIVASSSSSPEPYVRNGSVLKINLMGSLTERSVEDPFTEIFNPGASSSLSLDNFRNNMKKATSDDRIKGIWLDLGFLGGSWSGLHEVHGLLTDFKASGKFIYAYIGDLGANEAAYYLATTADSIFAQPEAMLEFDGFYISREFYKKAFDKYGISADVITSGPYKSAADSYRREDFSEGDREQLGALLSQFSEGFKEAVTSYSGINGDELDAYMNALLTFQASSAYERGLLDGFMQPFEFKDMIIERAGTSKLEDVSFARYSRVSLKSAGLTEPTGKEIAVVYMEGPIMPQVAEDIFSMGSQTITYSPFAKIFDDLAKDDNVGAVVLRVNSPGGAVTTSEILRAHIKKLSDSKPVVVSMGNVAASGGYYIAMGADTVFAESRTVTGSIGVVMAKLSVEKLLSETIGITVDEVKTHTNADWMTLERTLTNEQRQGLTNDLMVTYDNFLTLVADARGLDKEYVHEHAQGRVWSGRDAHELGLIDGIATLGQSIEVAAEMAGLESWKVSRYPTQKSFIETLMESSSKQARSVILSILNVTPDQTKLIRDLRSLNKVGVYSIIPYEISVN
jgi:protease IV